MYCYRRIEFHITIIQSTGWLYKVWHLLCDNDTFSRVSIVIWLNTTIDLCYTSSETDFIIEEVVYSVFYGGGSRILIYMVNHGHRNKIPPCSCLGQDTFTTHACGRIDNIWIVLIDISNYIPLLETMPRDIWVNNIMYANIFHLTTDAKVH